MRFLSRRYWSAAWLGLRSMSQSGSGNIEDVKSADEEEEGAEVQEEGIVEGAKDEIC